VHGDLPVDQAERWATAAEALELVPDARVWPAAPLQISIRTFFPVDNLHELHVGPVGEERMEFNCATVRDGESAEIRQWNHAMRVADRGAKRELRSPIRTFSLTLRGSGPATGILALEKLTRPMSMAIILPSSCFCRHDTPGVR